MIVRHDKKPSSAMTNRRPMRSILCSRTTTTSFVALLALMIAQGQAFGIIPLPVHHQPSIAKLAANTSPSDSHHRYYPSTKLSARPSRRKSNTATFYSNIADPPFESTKVAKSFGDRMRKLVLKEQKTELQQTSSGSKINPSKPSFVHEAVSLGAYKELVADEEERLVVVRFYAKWCRACKAVEPMFYRLARSMPDVKFVEVPVLEENANLHQGLGVPALPFAHIYHPQLGLVEELRMAKKEFKNFQSILEMYHNGEYAGLELDPETGVFLSPFLQE